MNFLRFWEELLYGQFRINIIKNRLQHRCFLVNIAKRYLLFVLLKTVPSMTFLALMSSVFFAISSSFLENGFSMIRRSGLKIVPRSSYSQVPRYSTRENMFIQTYLDHLVISQKMLREAPNVILEFLQHSEAVGLQFH